MSPRQLGPWRCVDLLLDELVVHDEFGESRKVSWTLVEHEVRRGRLVLGPDGGTVTLRQAERWMVGVAGG